MSTSTIWIAIALVKNLPEENTTWFFKCRIHNGLNVTHRICKIVMTKYHINYHFPLYLYTQYHIAENFQETNFFIITTFQLFTNNFRGTSSFINEYYIKTKFWRFSFLRIGQFAKSLKILFLQNFQLYGS